jgi:hypothetical protein
VAIAALAACVLAASCGAESRPPDAGARGWRAGLGLENASPTRGPLVAAGRGELYFRDGGGGRVYLTGAHTWNNLQDLTVDGRPRPRFDFGEYLTFLGAHGFNFMRLWAWEHGSWPGQYGSRYTIELLPYARTGPGTALDGGLKFDLTKFDDAYFARLRSRTEAAAARGVYVAVMLFNGWSLEYKGEDFGNPWEGHPFNRANNVNGIDGDPNGDGNGRELHTLSRADTLHLQEAYVARVLAAVGDLDNVVYEISNESHHTSLFWQQHLVRFIHERQETAAMKQPVGITVPWPGGNNELLLHTDAEWISPNSGPPQREVLPLWRRIWIRFPFVPEPDPVYPERSQPSVPQADKIVVSDTDHLWGIGGDSAWAWKAFLRGQNLLFMDSYDGSAAGLGVPAGYRPDAPQWVNLRTAMACTRAVRGRGDAAALAPASDLADSGFCLAGGGRLVAYAPGGEVRLNLTNQRASFRVEWFDPDTCRMDGAPAVDGGAWQTLTSPSGRTAVVHLSTAAVATPGA